MSERNAADAGQKSHRQSIGSIPRVIVTVAPVAHMGTYLPRGCTNPITPEEIGRECERCASAGASVVHLHVRDGNGEITSEMGLFTETLDLVTTRTDLIVNGSTGGASALSREERCVSVTDPRVEIASLNMGSTNFGDGVYINTKDDIRYWARRIYDSGALPELEVFGSSMIQTALELEGEGLLRTPLHFNVCLGFPGAAPATAQELAYLAGRIPAGANWAFLHEGMKSLRLSACALGLGASGLRVGYEDGGYLRPDTAARSNGELVEALVALIRLAGLEPATPAEARSMLGLATSRTDGGRR